MKVDFPALGNPTFGFFFKGLVVFDHGAEGNFHDDILTVLAETLVASTGLSIFGHQVFGVFQMQQRPQLGITAQDDVTAASAVTAVRTALGDVLRPVKVHRSRAAVSRCAVYLYVVYEIGIGHNPL